MREQELTSHLDALRTCIIRALVGLAAGTVVSFFLVPEILYALAMPYLKYADSIGIGQSSLISLSPSDTFQMSLMIALLGGIGLSLPWILYQAWRFVSPGLYSNERRCLLALAVPATVFFAIGAVFSYFVVLPAMVSFFHGYSTGLGFAPYWSASSYFEFSAMVIFLFGAAFEMPIVVVGLAWLGIVSPGLLTKYRRHAFVTIFIFAAIITPPDVISQLMMALPMVALYEISILAARVLCSRRKGQAPSIIGLDKGPN
ncbi:MAG: twin-arginine translocase subunit TatC [Proteobacteria bacterium]|nr:twin-arginine translocase subunit TatC [Pseudomonadota bacterium]